MEDRLHPQEEKPRDRRDLQREDPGKLTKRKPLSCITKEQLGEVNAIGEPASKALKQPAPQAFKDRTNFEDQASRPKPRAEAMLEEPKFQQLDWPGESLEQDKILPETKEKDEWMSAARRRPEQYVEELQPDIFDHCMRTEVGPGDAGEEPVQEPLLRGADRHQREDARHPRGLAGRRAPALQDEPPDALPGSQPHRPLPRSGPGAAQQAAARGHRRALHRGQVRRDLPAGPR